MTPQPAANIENPRRVQHDPTRANVWLPLAAAAVSALMACSSNARIPNADPAPAPAPTATETDPEPALTVPPPEPVSSVSVAEPEPVEAPCFEGEVAEGTVSLCFVAYGDPTVDGSGPDKLIEGVQIAMLHWRATAGAFDRDLWWEAVAGTGAASTPPGLSLRSDPQSIAAAGVPSVVTDAHGTAQALIQRGEDYQFCAVHPDEPGLIAGCSSFQWVRDGAGYSVHRDDYSLIRYSGSGGHRAIYVYFSGGRAFFNPGDHSGRYGRFLAGDTHPPGTGTVTVAGFTMRDYKGSSEIPVRLDDQFRTAVAVIEDEHIGMFWDVSRAGWLRQLDLDSPDTWPPARLLVTGADGTARADLAAGDYLFCVPYKQDTLPVCIYQDVTAGQDRILYPWDGEYGGIEELTEHQSAQLLDKIATCNLTGVPHWCATREQWKQAHDHYWATGEHPERW